MAGLFLGLLAWGSATACPDAMEVELADILKHTMSELAVEQETEKAIQNYHFVAVSAARRRDRLYKLAACELLVASLTETGQIEGRQDLYSSCADVDVELRGRSYDELLEDWKSAKMPPHLPIVRVAPVYPGRALRKGLEGYVDLKFTVTAQGTTTDITVVDSTDRIFDRAAKRAVTRFKYKPCVSDGQLVANPDVYTRVTFKLESL